MLDHLTLYHNHFVNSNDILYEAYLKPYITDIAAQGLILTKGLQPFIPRHKLSQEFFRSQIIKKSTVSRTFGRFLKFQ